MTIEERFAKHRKYMRARQAPVLQIILDLQIIAVCALLALYLKDNKWQPS